MSQCSWITNRTYCELPYEAHTKEDDRIIAQIGHNTQEKSTMKEAHGEFWNYPAEIRVITTNGMVKNNGACVMGRGVARQAKDKFPGIDHELGGLINQHGNRPFILNKEEGIASMPVKHHWKEQADLELIKDSAHKLVEMADKFGWQDVLVVRPGCGNGGLNWDDVRPVLEDIWDERFTVITFPPKGEEHTSKEVEANMARSFANQSEDTQSFVRQELDKLESAPPQQPSDEEYKEMFMKDIKEQYDFIVAATGSRSLQTKSGEHKQEVVKFLVAELQRLKEERGNILVVTGMAEGFDTAMAKAAQLTETPYLVAIPSPTYGKHYWGKNSLTGQNRLEEFEDYVNKAAHKVVVCDSYMGCAPRRPGKANFDRNQFMVDLADAFYVYNRESRGTKDCVARIKEAGKPHIFLDNHMAI